MDDDSIVVPTIFKVQLVNSRFVRVPTSIFFTKKLISPRIHVKLFLLF
ncbi:hypothetical protein LEP1GSC044_0568 [Leptospira kirschneri serovar Grippotyphosa str. RM52]|nr:hypothetical protein LEP1GSC044_0568 [Leptospira kirschneri serovar Grippotyphosa str. RM52]EMK06354.1 hypothetical protein LEP1GSC176_3694 [Leptospira kirschneri str. MMD1493]